MTSFHFRRLDIILLVAAISGFIYFTWSYHSTYPEAAIEHMISKETAESKATNLLQQKNLLTPAKLDSFSMKTRIRSDKGQIQYLQEKLGLKKAVDVFSDEIPVYVWSIEWLHQTETEIQIGNNSDDGRTARPKGYERVEIQIDGKGRLINYDCRLKSVDSLPRSRITDEELPPIPQNKTITISPDSAKKIVLAFLTQTAGIQINDFREDKFQTTVDNNNESYEFTFVSKSSVYDESVIITTRVRNSQIAFYEFKHQFPDYYKPHKERWLDQSQDIIDIVMIMLISLTVLIYFFIRFKSGAFDFKLGLFFGGVVAVGFAVMMALIMGTQSWVGLIVVIVFAGGWYLLISGISVAVSASLTREVWPEKYQTFEAIRRGRFWNQNFGTSLLRGILISGIVLGITSLILQTIPETTFVLNKQSGSKLDGYGAIFLIAAGLWTSIVYFHSFWLMPFSAIRRKSKQNWMIYGSGIIMGIIYPYILSDASPIWTRLVIGLFIGLTYTLILLRYDFLTLITAGLFTYIIQEGYFFLLMGDVIQSTILIIFLASILLVALVGALSRERGDDLLEFVPDYMREIEQKQRMQREFEIAREIQTTMLCCKTPQSSAFEIASMCEPAYEVGGDYYDFINFPGNNKVGIVIGDVSGKGVSAAFYMTLVKGILQTQASLTTTSTKETLCRVNEIFYDQVQRGKFISMIYAIFDFDSKRVLMSRAGHNPVLIKKSDTHDPEKVTPGGMAIGLTKGSAFSSQIEEVSIEFKSGDVFVFYTDGFSEAMNAKNEEFGEEKLYALIQQFSHLEPSSIIKSIHSEIGRFVGSTPQHDDMTMIVIKIK
ncbi:SpoIIE family protein phosphatase [bacterium]|nr:SpoIIE family protein phosphatase [bacterium]